MLTDGSNVFILIGACLFALVASCVIIAAMAVANTIRDKRRLSELTRYSININNQIGLDSVKETIETYINDCLDEYLILNPKYASNSVYLTDEDETTIRNDVKDMVSARISPAFVDKLSTYYRKEDLGNIIGSKIYISVMNYVVHANQLKLRSEK